MTSSIQRPLPSMEIRPPASRSMPVNLSLVNRLPWSVLKISGLPYRAIASSRADTQKSGQDPSDAQGGRYTCHRYTLLNIAASGMSGLDHAFPSGVIHRHPLCGRERSCEDTVPVINLSTRMSKPEKFVESYASSRPGRQRNMLIYKIKFFL